MYFVGFFFFKQKTAYEMRISDWSSDVCSSDLQRQLERIDDLDPLGRPDPADGVDRRGEEREIEERPEPADEEHDFGGDEQDHAVAEMELHHRRVIAVLRFLDDVAPPRSEERRVGKEGVSTCRFRW